MDGLMMDYPLTVPALLDRAARYFPRVEVVSRRPDRSLARSSYGEVRRRAHQLAGALARLGVGRGDRVATLGWNNARHLEAYFGVPLMGGVVHTLNPRLAAADLVYIVNHAGDSVLLADDVLMPVLGQLRDQMNLKHVVVWTNGTQAPEGTIDGEELIAAEPEEFARPRLDELEAAAMCYTSGTTGRPKGVRVFAPRDRAALAGLGHDRRPGDRRARRGVPGRADVPRQRLGAAVHAPPWSGASRCFPGRTWTRRACSTCSCQEGVTLTAGVPTIWMGILQALDKEPDRWNLGAAPRWWSGGRRRRQA